MPIYIIIHRLSRMILPVVLLAGVQACSNNSDPTVVGNGYPAQVTAITNVQLLLQDNATQTGPQTIIIRDGFITEVGPSGRVAVPDQAELIDGKNRFVMPGLWDMHYHAISPAQGPLDSLRSALPWGITAIMDPGTSNDAYQLMTDGIAQEPDGFPALHAAIGMYSISNGYGDGMASPFLAPTTEQEARRLVRNQKAQGAQLVKLAVENMDWLSTNLMPVIDGNILRTLIDEAHRQGMLAVAHAPMLELAKEAVRAGIDMLAHGVIDRPVDEELIALMRETGTHYTSTYIVFESFADFQAWLDELEAYDRNGWLDAESLARWRKAGDIVIAPIFDKVPLPPENLKILKDNLVTVAKAGIPILIGTDTGLPAVFPGISMHLEMVRHTEAGLPPDQVLRAATINAAKFLGREAEAGSIAAGKVGDIIILDADPRDDMRNLGRINQVIRGGSPVRRPTPG